MEYYIKCFNYVDYDIVRDTLRRDFLDPTPKHIGTSFENAVSKPYHTYYVTLDTDTWLVLGFSVHDDSSQIVNGECVETTHFYDLLDSLIQKLSSARPSVGVQGGSQFYSAEEFYSRDKDTKKTGPKKDISRFQKEVLRVPTINYKLKKYKNK